MAIICTPSALVSAAKCFNCLTTKQLRSVRAYLLSQFVPCVPAGSPPGTPPVVGCNAPAAPANLEVTPIANNPGSTTIAIDWTQPASNPPVTTNNYAIIWSVPRGPINFAVIPGTQLSYTITGLTPSTDYSIVVRAIHGACASSSSVLHTTTAGSGPPPNGLLNGLVHFYQFQEAAAMFADSGSDPIVLGYTNAGAGFSRVAGHVQAFAGNYADGAGGPDKVGTIAAAPFDFTGDGTGNISMTWALWMRLNGASGGQPATLTLMSVHTPVYFFAWLNTNFLEFSMQTAGGVQTNLQSAFVYDNNWHLMVGGFDQPNGVIFFSLDNGAKITAPVAQVKSVNSVPYAVGNCDACGGNNGNWSFSDCATWLNRALTASDISKLWNGGAGLPFSQFTT